MVLLKIGLMESAVREIAKEIGLVPLAEVRTSIDAACARAAHDITSIRLPIDLPGALQKLERQYLVEAMRQARGNKAEAARLLGFKRPALYAKLDRFEIAENEWRIEPSP